MDSPAFDRGRWERFAELLEQADGSPRRHRRSQDRGHGHGQANGELAGLVRLTGQLRQVTNGPAPSTQFAQGLRAQLMARIERDGIGASAAAKAAQAAARTALAGDTQVVKPVTNVPSRARTVLFAGVIAGAIALSSVSWASNGAVPGDTLYGVKRSSERAKLALAGSEISRAQLLLEFAHARVIEAARVDPRLLQEVLADMDDSTRQGVSLLNATAIQKRDPATLDVVLRFVAAQRERLGGVSKERVTLAGESFQASLALLDAVEVRAKQLAVVLKKGCPAGSIDSLGPKPSC